MSGTEHTPHTANDRSAHMSAERAAFERRRRLRQQRRKQRLLMAGVAALLAVTLMALTAWVTYQKGMRGLSASRKMTLDGAAGAWDHSGNRGASASNRVNVLLVGTDEEPDHKGRADTMMLVSYDTRTGDAGVLSIPRDTRVRIPGRTGYHRINAAQVLGGPQLALRTVEQLLGVPIDHYVVVSYTGFERLVDLLGGVTMLVERPMRYDDFAQGLHIDIKAGLQLLDGKQALHYVRFRGDRLGDISLVDPARELYDGRVKRQLDFMQAVAAEALSWKALPKLPQLVPQLFAMVETNMSYDRATALAVSLRHFDTDRLDVAVLPGTSDIVGGASYWVHDPVRTRIIVDRVIRGERVVTLEVLNGNGNTGVAARAADLLRRSGFDVVRVGNAPGGFGYDETQIIVRRRDAGPDKQQAAAYTDELQRLIGGRVTGQEHVFGVVQPEGMFQDPGGRDVKREPVGADATIIIGRDFSG